MIDFVLNHFDELAALPGAVPKLRSFILDQAVRGNLTADWRREHPDVEPVSALLERIREEKKELVKAGKIKKQKELPPVDSDEVPFEIPGSWEWVRLGDCHIIEMGTSPPGHTYNRERKGAPLINGPAEFEKSPYGTAWSSTFTTAGRSFCEPNDSLICVRGATTGRLNFAAHRACIGRGVKFPAITKDQLFRWPFPVPSAMEQFEIVRRVDELMVLCDRLETSTAHLENARRNALASGAIHLTDDAAGRPFAKRWQSFADRLPELVQDPDDTKAVQDAILQLAVRGQLTADWRAKNPDVEPASVLLERIRADKKKLEKAGKIKKQKEPPPVDSDEVPFEVPETWEWVRLRELAEVYGGGTPSKSKSEYWGDDYLWITPKDMKRNEIVETELKITATGLRNSSATLIQGPAIVVVGRSGILRRRIPIARCDGEFTVNQDMKVFKPLLSDLVNYMMCFLRGMEPIGLAYLVKYGMTVHSLRYDEYAGQPFPLASLQEQMEIVRRVEHLMTVVDRLKKTAAQRNRHAETVLTALEKT